MGRDGDPLESWPPQPCELPTVHAARIQSLAERQVHFAARGPVPENDGFRPAPEIEPGLALDHAELGELRARALLRALARGDPRVHQDVAVAGDEGGEGAQPPKPLVERAAQLGPDLVQSGGRPVLAQRDLVITEDGEGVQPPRELEDTGTVRAAIDEVTTEGELVAAAVEAG